MTLKNESVKKTIEMATVTLTRLDGRGVLVPGNIILTAAHCVDFSTKGGMVLGDFYIEDIKTNQGKTIKAAPVFVDPVCDLAALGCLDDQVFPEEAIVFTELCEQLKPVCLSTKELVPIIEKIKSVLIADPNQSLNGIQSERFPINIYNHKGEWSTGLAYYSDGPLSGFDVEKPIEGGTSGSPIVTDDGELIGVVSNGTTDGLFPVPNIALPAWLLRKIKNAQALYSMTEV